MTRKLALALAFAAAAALAPLASSAQEYPPPPPPGAPPPQQGPYQPYGYGQDVSGFHLRGTVAYFRPYFLILDTGGRRIAVHLHVGTVILPTGLTLQPGMFIAINGYWIRRYGVYYRYGGGASFVADRIVLLR